MIDKTPESTAYSHSCTVPDSVSWLSRAKHAAIAIATWSKVNQVALASYATSVVAAAYTKNLIYLAGIPLTGIVAAITNILEKNLKAAAGHACIAFASWPWLAPLTMPARNVLALPNDQKSVAEGQMTARMPQNVSKTMEPAYLPKEVSGQITSKESERINKNTKTTHFDLQTGVIDENMKKLSDGEIIIHGQILTDGLGDYFNLLTLTNNFHNEYPGQKIRLIITGLVA